MTIKLLPSELVRGKRCLEPNYQMVSRRLGATVMGRSALAIWAESAVLDRYSTVSWSTIWSAQSYNDLEPEARSAFNLRNYLMRAAEVVVLAISGKARRVNGYAPLGIEKRLGESGRDLDSRINPTALEGA